MEYKVEHDINSDVYVVRISGIHKRPQDSHKLLRFVGTIAAEHECSKFLFDMREATILGGTIDTYNAVIDHEKYGVSKLFRIAAVYPAITEDNRFMENVGVNRGATAFRVFDDISAVREWITKE